MRFKHMLVLGASAALPASLAAQTTAPGDQPSTQPSGHDHAQPSGQPEQTTSQTGTPERGTAPQGSTESPAQQEMAPPSAERQAPAQQSQDQPAAQPGTASSTAPAASLGTVVRATASDLTAGATVLDRNGETIGTVQSVSAEGAVVTVGTARVLIPAASFGKSERGLVIGATKAQVEAQARAATPQ